MSLDSKNIQGITILDIDNEINKPKTAKELVARTREVFRSGKTVPISFRKKQLKNLRNFLLKEEEALCKATYEDLKKSKAETIVHEINLTVSEINIALKNIDDWAKPKSVRKTFLNFFDSLYIYSDPLGVVLVISAWNYPIQLTFAPLVGKFFHILAKTVFFIHIRI